MQRDAIEQRTVRQIDEVLQLERLMKSPSIEPAGRDQLGRLWAAQARDAGGEVEQKEQEDPEPGLEERDLDRPAQPGTLTTGFPSRRSIFRNPDPLPRRVWISSVSEPTS